MAVLLGDWLGHLLRPHGRRPRGSRLLHHSGTTWHFWRLGLSSVGEGGGLGSLYGRLNIRDRSGFACLRLEICFSLKLCRPYMRYRSELACLRLKICFSLKSCRPYMRDRSELLESGLLSTEKCATDLTRLRPGSRKGLISCVG